MINKINNDNKNFRDLFLVEEAYLINIISLFIIINFFI